MSRRGDGLGFQSDIAKEVLKESNKHCADCRYNVSRWASVTQGIFICIACSGKHRGLGTDYSRVKSIDLDYWSKEHRDTMLAWGNTKANKFWEAKIKPADIPQKGISDNQRGRFIHEKYVEKKYALNLKKPTPDMVSDGEDDDVPLNVVQQKAKSRAASAASQQPPPPPYTAKPEPSWLDAEEDLSSQPTTTHRKMDGPTTLIGDLAESSSQSIAPPYSEKPPIDLSGNIKKTSSQRIAPPPKANSSANPFGHLPAPPVRPSTTDVPVAKPPPPQSSATSKPTAGTDSLLGGFFGGSPSAAVARPSSSDSIPTGSTGPPKMTTRNIMSLYNKPPAQPPQNLPQPSSGALQSPPAPYPSALGDLGSAFGNLNFNPQMSPPASPPMNSQQTRADPFASINKSVSERSSAAPPKVTSPLGNGGFFAPGYKPMSKPSVAPKPPPAPTPKVDPPLLDDFGGFTSVSNLATTASNGSMPKASSDLFGFSELAPPATVPPPLVVPPQKPTPPAPAPAPAPAPSNTSSVFNLSTRAPPPPPAPKAAVPPTAVPTTSSSAFSNMDAWGSSNAWATPDPTPSVQTAPQPKPAATIQAPSIPMSSDFSAWGANPAASNLQSSAWNNGFSSTSQAAPNVATDEDFGGWSSAAPVSPAAPNPVPQQSKPAGGGGGFRGGEDLYSNVWE